MLHSWVLRVCVAPSIDASGLRRLLIVSMSFILWSLLQPMVFATFLMASMSVAASSYLTAFNCASLAWTVSNCEVATSPFEMPNSI